MFRQLNEVGLGWDSWWMTYTGFRKTKVITMLLVPKNIRLNAEAFHLHYLIALFIIQTTFIENKHELINMNYKHELLYWYTIVQRDKGFAGASDMPIVY